MTHESNGTPSVPAIEKALDILEYVAQCGGSVMVKELSSALEIPQATAYRTVKYLLARKYLAEHPQIEGGYVLGPQFLYMAHLAGQQSKLQTGAEPVMRWLAGQTGHTTQLGILQDYSVTYIEQVLPTRPVNIIAALRTLISVNVSAAGKVLVAFLPKAEQARFLQHARLADQTPNSITDPNALADELGRVREQGYALDHEEYARGIGCCAAPVYDHRGEVIAAIGITGQITAYHTPENRAHLIGLVQTAAQNISKYMGGHYPFHLPK